MFSKENLFEMVQSSKEKGRAFYTFVLFCKFAKIWEDTIFALGLDVTFQDGNEVWWLTGRGAAGRAVDYKSGRPGFESWPSLF